MNPLPTIIQGGMGVAISSWRLANAVSREGQLGVVSGTGIAIVMIARLMQGDPGGHIRRALAHFPFQEPVQRILQKYYVEGGIPSGTPYKRATMWSLNPPRELNELTVIANFVEVWLAKEGHDNAVGINLLEKVQMPNMASLYGAMLAGVDVVIMGAGIPMQIPGILDELAHHRPVSYRLDVIGATEADDIRIHFDPQRIFPDVKARVGVLRRPLFFPIVSSVVLAQALLKRATGRIDGFVVELPSAGGHNAPPRGQLQLNEAGEPIYGAKDAVDIEKIQKLGLPFWLAGGYGTPQMLVQAQQYGAVGIQVGTAFAYCDESGLDPELRQRILLQVLDGTAKVYTSPIASPTGYPFKVVQVAGTVADPSIYAQRPRLCDLGYLRHIYKAPDGTLGYRCPAEPIDAYIQKGGDVADTVGRVCLCNQLGSAAGFPNTRRDGYTEPAIVTSGDELVHLEQFIPQGQTHYSARDVIAYLLSTVTA